MNLVTETYRFARWTVGVTLRFLRVRPWSTVAVTLASAVEGVLQLLAFLVPLKIILLAASPGIPRYFPFIDPTHKTPWIIGLSTGAVAAYLTSLLLNTLSARWSRSAGWDVLRGANDLVAHAKEEEQIHRAFADFTGIIAALLFLSAAGAVLIWANLALAAFLVGMVVLLGLVSALALAGNCHPPSPFKAWLIKKTGEYLGFWRVLTFFGALGVIIYPFLFGQDGNIFLAIIAFIMLRQMLGNITGVIGKGVSLARRRPAIDGLIYRSQQPSNSGEEDRFHEMRILFAPEKRDSAIAEALRGPLGDGIEIRSTYVDPAPARIKRFDVLIAGAKSHLPRLEARAYPTSCKYQIANAEFLFRHISRGRLNAPPIWARFDYSDYTMIVQEAGDGNRCERGSAWPSIQSVLVGNILSVQPPKKLLRSYFHTQRMLPDRLTESFCERLWIGVDNEEETRELAAFLARREEIVGLLREHPLALYNPEINPTNVIEAFDRPLLMAWGKWALEPIGAAMARYGWEGDKARAHIEGLSQSRVDLVSWDWVAGLPLGADCHKLEQAINGEQYKAGLRVVRRLQARDSAGTGRPPGIASRKFGV